MIKIALVGDIGSGKSHISKLFNYPVFNADHEVTEIYKKDKNCFKKIHKMFPKQIFSFPIKKNELINCILDKPKNLKKISDVVHPVVRKKLNFFIKKNKNKKFIILDIPLYLENKLNSKKDIIVFIDSKKEEIKKRLLKRKGFNKDLLNIFRKIQLSLKLKKKASNFIIKNDFSSKTVNKSVKNIILKLSI